MEDDLNLEIINYIEELDRIRQYRDSKEIYYGDKDRYGYPCEPFDAFSTEPLTFNETGLRLQTEARQTFNIMRILNRRSPEYIQMSRRMEKMISLLGSCCITRAVLEQQGCEFPMLKTLTIESLREMTAFNFRKISSAFTESIFLYKYQDGMFDLSIRWAALDKRLKATQEKIEKIKAGEIKVELKTKSGTAVSSEKSYPKEEHEEPEKAPAPFTPQGCALPVDKSAIREIEQLQEEEEPAGSVFTAPETPSDNPESISATPENTPEAYSETPAETPEASAEPAGAALYPAEDEQDGVPYDEDEWDGPYVSDDLVRRMAEYWQRQAMLPVMEECEAPP